MPIEGRLAKGHPNSPNLLLPALPAAPLVGLGKVAVKPPAAQLLAVQLAAQLVAQLAVLPAEQPAEQLAVQPAVQLLVAQLAGLVAQSLAELVQLVFAELGLLLAVHAPQLTRGNSFLYKLVVREGKDQLPLMEGHHHPHSPKAVQKHGMFSFASNFAQRKINQLEMRNLHGTTAC